MFKTMTGTYTVDVDQVTDDGERGFVFTPTCVERGMDCCHLDERRVAIWLERLIGGMRA